MMLQTKRLLITGIALLLVIVGCQNNPEENNNNNNTDATSEAEDSNTSQEQEDPDAIDTDQEPNDSEESMEDTSSDSDDSDDSSDSDAPDESDNSNGSNDSDDTVEEDIPWLWEHDTPENHDLDPAAFERLHSTLDPTNVYTSVTVKDGVIVDEYYKEGYDETSVFELNSTSKSVMSTLFGIAVDKGYISSLETPISEYFPQVLDFEDSRWQDITIWHLLTHTSGIASTDSALWNEWRASDNWMAYIFDRPIVSQPGSTFDYSTGNSHLLSAILEQATDMSMMEFGNTYLFEPLDMDSVVLGVDAQGVSDGGNGFSMNPYDMAKLGQLYINQGRWNDEQIVSSDWITEATSTQFVRSSGSADYGYQWWVRTFGPARYDAFFAQGHAGQYIFVIPDIELVIVFTSNHTGSSSMYWQFVSDIVAAYQGS